MATIQDVAAALQTSGGVDFGDGAFAPDEMVTIHNVSNLEDGLTARIIAFDTDKGLYVVKDAAGSIWGLRSDKLRPLHVLDLDAAGETWQEVPTGVAVPAGVDVKMDLCALRWP